MEERTGRTKPADHRTGHGRGCGPGSPTVEAEHLLLAISRRGGETAEAMRELGLHHASILAALERHTAAALGMVGVSEAAYGPVRPLTVDRSRLRFAASMKRALHASAREGSARRSRTMKPAHLLLGLLTATRGMVPRTLALAGVDIEALKLRLNGLA